jgi:hypothetical protein
VLSGDGVQLVSAKLQPILEAKAAESALRTDLAPVGAVR